MLNNGGELSACVHRLMSYYSFIKMNLVRTKAKIAAVRWMSTS